MSANKLKSKDKHYSTCCSVQRFQYSRLKNAHEHTAIAVARDHRRIQPELFTQNFFYSCRAEQIRIQILVLLMNASSPGS